MADEDICAAVRDLQRWLFEAALPLWWQTGADPQGGFYERIDPSGKPVALSQRTRTIARQAFCYCEAGRLGWTGPWRAAARHALDYFESHYFLPDGTVASAVSRDGTVSDAEFDLYEQAFALFALAHAHQTFRPEPQWRARAMVLRERLRTAFAHPEGGYFEDRDRCRTPLRSNPHMHLLEAALAWMRVDEDDEWRIMADDIAALCLGCFIDPDSGALREFFARDWSPTPGLEGQLVEPGHQYEWAFLLERWASVTNQSRPAEIARLVSFADAHGIDPVRRVAINAILMDGSLHDAGVRLWPQTERIRAYAALRMPEPLLGEAVAGLRRHLASPVAGAWVERFTPDGAPIDEPAPATSLYHIIGAVAALQG